jgi:hypothetical protein
MDPIVRLVRLENNHNYGMFGVLIFHGEYFCTTLEPPWFDNMQNTSCIPTGQYLCSSVNSPKFGHTYEIRHVPNRDSILFHAGNRVRDTQGCILLAQYPGKLRGDRAVLNSGATFSEFLRRLDGVYTFCLTIVEQF